MEYKCKECNKTLINLFRADDGIRYIKTENTINLMGNAKVDLVNCKIENFNIKCPYCRTISYFTK